MYMNKQRKLEQDGRLLENWEWLTEGLEGEDKVNASIVLQNSYETMIQENQLPEGWLEALLNEDESFLTEAPNRAGNVGTNLIPKVLFPVIRRVMPSLIANQLVSVQPIAARTGVVYHIDFSFSNTKGGITAKDEYAGSAQTAKQGPGFATWYSSNKIGPFETTLTADQAADITLESGDKITGFLGTDPTQFLLKRVEVYVNGSRVETALSTAFDGSFSTGSNVAYTAATGDILLNESFGLLDEDVVKLFVVYDQEGSKHIPEMEFSIGSMPVETDSRKLKIRWTKEAEQDMNAYHKIDVESELVKVASMEMNYEVDRELLTYISDIVPTQLSFLHNWTADEPVTGNNTRGNYLDRHRALAQKMYQVSAKISQYNRQGPANWGVVSPSIAAVLSMLPDYEGEISGNNYNIHENGKLKNNLKVYVDPNREGDGSNEILLGFKSNTSSYGAGVVYSPYTNWMSGTVTDPDNFNNVRGFFSRYAISKVERGEWFYGKVEVDNVVI